MQERLVSKGEKGGLLTIVVVYYVHQGGNPKLQSRGISLCFSWSGLKLLGRLVATVDRKASFLNEAGIVKYILWLLFGLPIM